ncbi:MAG: antitoxin Xre-like helix-turn-helix domain-containing protein [Ferruginibacter sp.]
MAIATAIPNSILAKFGNLDLNNNFALVFLARKGIEPKVFYDFAGTINMPEKTLAELLNLSSRTISNYKALQKNLEPAQSEHLLKLISLFGKGEVIFGNINEFNYWLQKPFWNAREKPIDWLNTPGGIDLLTEELDRLAYAYTV